MTKPSTSPTEIFAQRQLDLIELKFLAVWICIGIIICLIIFVLLKIKFKKFTTSVKLIDKNNNYSDLVKAEIAYNIAVYHRAHTLLGDPRYPSVVELFPSLKDVDLKQY